MTDKVQFQKLASKSVLLTNMKALCVPEKLQLTASKFQTVLIPRHAGKDHAGCPVLECV